MKLTKKNFELLQKEIEELQDNELLMNMHTSQIEEENNRLRNEIESFKNTEDKIICVTNAFVSCVHDTQANMIRDLREENEKLKIEKEFIRARQAVLIEDNDRLNEEKEFWINKFDLKVKENIDYVKKVNTEMIFRKKIKEPLKTKEEHLSELQNKFGGDVSAYLSSMGEFKDVEIDENKSLHEEIYEMNLEQLRKYCLDLLSRNAQYWRKENEHKKPKLNEIKFMELGPAERKLLLLALDVNPDNLKCKKCGDILGYKDCAILPGTEANEVAVFLCNSSLCMCEYMYDCE